MCVCVSFAEIRGEKADLPRAIRDGNIMRRRRGKYYFNAPIYRVGLSAGQEPGTLLANYLFPFPCALAISPSSRGSTVTYLLTRSENISFFNGMPSVS